MDDTTNVPISDIPFIVAAIKQQVNDVETEISSLTGKKDKLLQILKNLEGLKVSVVKTTREEPVQGSNKLTVGDNGYNSTWSRFKKATFILNRECRPLTTAEIVNYLRDLEPYLSVRKTNTALSSVLATKVEMGKVKRVIENGVKKFEL